MDILGPRSQTLGTWLAFLLAAGWIVYELRRDDQLPTGAAMSGKLLPIGIVVAVLFISAVMHVIAAVINRRPEASEDKSQGVDPAVPKETGEKRVSTVPLARQPDIHEECKREIRNLESQVQRLSKHDETQGIQISSRDTRIEQLEAELARLGWLREIAARQSESVDKFVQISWLILGHSLIEKQLFIYFRVRLHSSCVYELTANALSGFIRIGNRPLGSVFPVNQTAIIESNEVQRLKIGETGFLTVTQPLTRDDAVFILNGDNEFFFDRLSIELQTLPETDSRAKLSSLNSSISNKEIREKYPKLDIKFKLAGYFHVVERREEVDSRDQVITLEVTIENARKTRIDIESVEVSVVSLRHPRLQLLPDTGEIYEKRFVDADGSVKPVGKPLKNLAASLLAIIGRGKVSGCFQFFVEDVAVDALTGASVSLILTDKYGEHHVGNHDLTHIS